MAWDGPILTDSGGFQVFSLADLRRVDDDGVTFTSHLDGSTHRLTPERAMEIQALLGSDVAMALDQLVDPGAGSGTVAEAMERTHRWAERSLAARGRPTRPCSGSSRAASIPSCDAHPWRRSALPFDGIAVGGLSVGESKAERPPRSTSWPTRWDDPRPRYLMGVGSPADFFGAERGIDLFDCVLPTRVARTGQVWTDAGRINLRNAALLDDPAPIDAGARARVRSTRGRISRPLPRRELLAYRLATVHNVTWTLELMRRLRASLADGTFAELAGRVRGAFARSESRV